MHVTWKEVNDEWPWSRVLRALDVLTRERHIAAHTPSILTAAFLNVHRAKGTAAFTARDVLHPAANPFAGDEGVEAPYSEAVVAAFELAFARKLTGNAALSAFGIRELRASGFTGEARSAA